MDFQVWDFPGQLDYLDNAQFDVDSIFSEIGALIWVIDAQDDFVDSLNRLFTSVIYVQQNHPAINIEVFIHKVDGLSEDYKIDTQREIIQRLQDELSDNGFENINISYHLTSIYDHSIFEAFSKVIQKLIPVLPTLEGLLNVLCSNSGLEKVYLFDVLSKIYIATDASPVDIASYEICSDFIDVIIDMSDLYTYDRTPKIHGREQENGHDDKGKRLEAPTVDTYVDKFKPESDFENLPDEEQEAEAMIKISNGLCLYLREMNK
jgi:Ras-related GTP-binding protein C/D